MDGLTCAAGLTKAIRAELRAPPGRWVAVWDFLCVCVCVCPVRGHVMEIIREEQRTVGGSLPLSLSLCARARACVCVHVREGGMWRKKKEGWVREVGVFLVAGRKLY